MKPPHIQQKCSTCKTGTIDEHGIYHASHICCDGECNHDDCCGKVKENCPNYYKESNRPDLHHAPTQPEWIPKLTQLLTIHATGKYHSESLFISELKFLISTTIQKEIERERESIVEIVKKNKIGEYDLVWTKGTQDEIRVCNGHNNACNNILIDLSKFPPQS